MRIGILGTGLMGKPLAMRLLDAGHDLVACNRTAAKLLPLKERGAETASDARTLTASGTVATVLMLSDFSAIREAFLQPLQHTGLHGHTVLQMGTIAPEESRTLERDLTARGAEYLEAPVLGSVPQAEKGTLIVLVGSSREQFQKWADLLHCFGNPIHIGPVGQAAAVKLAANQLIASMASAFALSLALLERQGIDGESFMTVLRNSALFAPTFEKKLPRILNRTYGEPHFPLRHLLKDVDLFLRDARNAGVPTTTLEGVRQLLATAQNQGMGDLDYAVLVELLRS